MTVKKINIYRDMGRLRQTPVDTNDILLFFEMRIGEFIEYVAYVLEGYFVWLYDTVTGRRSRRTNARLSECKACEHNKSGVCDLCGCIIKAKVRVDFETDVNGKSVDGCPERRW